MKNPVLFQNQPVIELKQNGSRALFAPQIGARLLLWEVNGRTIITWPEEADWSKPAKVRGGNPILFPFIARHFVDGIPEKWRDEEGIIRNMPSHGFCREAVFQEIPEDGDTIRMRLKESATTLSYYPFPFQFDVVYRLLDGGLEVEFAVTNTGTRPLPYDAGHHFYFAIPHAERGQWSLDLPFARTGRQTPDGSIVEEPNQESSTTLDRPEIIDRFQIQPTHSYFALHNVQRSQKIAFDLGIPDSIPWYAVTTWTQAPDSDFYCVEPWLGLPNSIHHHLGLRWLPSGQTERAICRLLI